MLLTDTDNGKTVHVKIGEVINIQLKENPTTGYRWAVDSTSENIVFQQATFSPSPTQAIGSGGIRMFHFIVKQVGTGTASIHLKHWREWEGDASITKHYDISFSIQ